MLTNKLRLFFCFTAIAFGCLANGSEQEIGIYEIKKGDFSVKITNYGARVISVVLPDKNGRLGDVVLGYDTINEYLNDKSNFGSIVGRVANRIGGAQFTLNGTHYKLDANEGKNMLHGGFKGFSLVVWKVKKYKKDRITFTHHSADGEAGFPGDVLVSTTYKLIKPYQMSVVMKAKALNKATPVNMAQHCYWNLGGHDSGDILSDEVQIFASHITPTDAQLIPTGEIAPTKNTPYDFLKPRPVGSQIGKLPNGYDINYALDGYEGGQKAMIPAAKVYSKKSGRMMEIFTNAPGVQFYTANHVKDLKGKDGYIYQAHAALCLETQAFPDSVNHPNFPSTIVAPGKTYAHYMLFKFFTKKY